MKKLIILLLIGSVAMGIHDGGDITGAVLLAVILLPGICERKRKEACAAATGQTSCIKDMQLNLHNDYNLKNGVCQGGSADDQ